MTVCAVIDSVTNEQISLIVADPSDLAPEGCHLIEIPSGFYWDGNAVVPIEVPAEVKVTDGD